MSVPYTLEGAFTAEEREIIESALRPHVPDRVDAGFNNWTIGKLSPVSFFAMRATWGSGIGANSAQELADKITNCYTIVAFWQ